MIYDLLFLLALIGLATAPLFRWLWKSELERCRYQLFSVRDDLVYYAASNKLDKESEPFLFYYKSVNQVLNMTETMNLQGLIKFLKSDAGSKEEFDAHERKLQDIKLALEISQDEVRDSVGSYYSTLREMLLINSNFFSVAYLLTRHHKKINERLRSLGLVKPKIVDAYSTIKTECDTVGLAVCQ